MAHSNRERSNMTRPKRVTIQEPSDVNVPGRVGCASSGTASIAASASEGGSNYGTDLGSLWKRPSASIIGGLGISQEAMENSSSQPSREEEEETESSWWTGFGGFTGSSAAIATSVQPTAKQLNEDLIKRSCHSRSGHRTLLLVEEAVEAFQDARLTANKAAKVITRFLRHSASALKQVNLDIQFWEDELDCIDFDLSNELQDIQKSTEMRKKMIAMELEQEFKTSDSALDKSKDKVDQLSDEIAQEKLLHEKLKEHIKRLERENAQLAVLDPVLLEEMAQAEKQVRRLTRQTQQLTAVHDKYQTEHTETKRRLDMYQQARQDRRDQRKCCQRYIDRIIQMTQLKLGQEGHNLVRRIKHQKRENQLQQDALRASTSHKQPRRSSNDKGPKQRPSPTAATLHSSTTVAKGDKMSSSNPSASLKSSTDHKQRRSTTTRPRKPARRTQSFNNHESATSESGPDSTNRSLDEREPPRTCNAKKKLERRCKSFNHSTISASDVESGDHTNNMKRSSSSFTKNKKKKTTSNTSGADRCASTGNSNKAAQKANANRDEIEPIEACCDASFKSGESFHDETKNFCDFVGVDDDEEECDGSDKQRSERRDGAVRVGGNGEATNNFSDAVAIDDEEEQEEEHNKKSKAKRGETRAATGDGHRRESASPMSWKPAPERPQDRINNLDTSSCSPSMHQALLWIQSQDDSTIPKDTTTNRSSNNNHLAVRSPRSPQSVILETRKC